MEESKTEIVEIEPQPETLAEVIAPLIPLAESYFKQGNETLKAQLEVTKMQSEHDFSLKEKQLQFDLHKFNWLFVLLLMLSLCLIAIAGGIIFVLRDVQTGLLLLSHLVAIATGVMGGLGLKKALDKDKKD